MKKISLSISALLVLVAIGGCTCGYRGMYFQKQQ